MDNSFLLILVLLILGFLLPFLIFLIQNLKNILPYLYANARIKAKEAKLIKPETIDEMINKVRSCASSIRSMGGIVTLYDDDNEKDVLISKNEVLELLVDSSPPLIRLDGIAEGLKKGLEASKGSSKSAELDK